jgi:hypothetical protein
MTLVLCFDVALVLHPTWQGSTTSNVWEVTSLTADDVASTAVIPHDGDGSQVSTCNLTLMHHIHHIDVFNYILTHNDFTAINR